MGGITDADVVGRVSTCITDVDIVIAGEHAEAGTRAHCDVVGTAGVSECAFTDGRVAAAGGASECAETDSRVAASVYTANERPATDGNVETPACVARERIVTDGRVVVRVAAKKRLKTNGWSWVSAPHNN